MRLVYRRGVAGVLGFAFLFSLVPLALIPTAAALTWTVQTLDSDVGTGGGASGIAVNGNIVLIAYEDENDDLSIQRGVDGSFTPSTIHASGSAGQLPHLRHLSGSTFIGCEGDATNGDILQFKSSDNGVFWSFSAVESDQGTGCQVGIPGDTTVTIGYLQAATTAKAKVSADSGESYGAFNTIAASTGTVKSFQEKSSTAWAWGLDGNFCRTADSGATFTCTSATGIDRSPDIEYFGTTWYMIGADSATLSQLTFAKSTNDGATFATSVIHTTAASRTIGWTRLVVHDAETYSAFWCESVAPQTPLLMRSVTTNAGASWTEETVDTGTASHLCAAKGDVALDAGVFYVSYSFGAAGSDAVLKYATAVFSSSSLEALASVAVTNLVGFDVSPTGNSLITRDGTSGVSIHSYAAFTLASLYTTGTGCTTTDRVLASDRTLIAFVTCDTGTGVSDLLKTRTTVGGTPPYANCPDCPADSADLSFDEWPSPSDSSLNEISELLSFPLSFEQRSCFSGGCSFAQKNYAAYAWSSTDGTIGVNSFTVNDPGFNGGFSDEVSFSGSGVDQMCAVTWSGNNFLMGVRSGVSTAVYRVTMGFTDDELDATITGPQTFPSAVGIGCAEDRIILAMNSGTEVRMYNLTTGAQVWSITGLVLATSRSVAFSNNGDWCAYVTTTAIIVCDASDGSSLASLTLPSGTHKGVKMSRAGQFLWYATDDNLAVWDIHTETTGDSVSDSPGGSLDPGEDIPGDEGFFTAPDIDGVSSFGSNLLFGLIVVVGMTVGVGGAPAAATRGRQGFSIILAVIGAALGVGMAWALGYFTAGVVFAIVVLVGGGAYLLNRRATGG